MHAEKLFLLVLWVFISACASESSKAGKEVVAKNVSIDHIAGNEDVKQYMQSFESRGIQSDDSLPTPSQQALNNFRFSDDLEMDLLLAEPQVHQPVFINFDHRGRLWVVQYNQYPYPEGVKVVDIDNHNRAVFDKVPLPPTKGVKGADKITIFEDTDSDGVFDTSVDAITGLNIATSVTLGRGKIWVLTPPYLVAYPDPDGDGLPDGDPEVHLDGFGIQDTHAVANSLRWGPDGWLYGAQGSTTISTINSAVSKNVHFKGQAFWRYHPDSKVFEVYAEGGGNTFYVEIDDKGRFYSGTNEVIRGYYYKQGGYYKKNWGKHGALTNPYALGYLPGIPLDGDRIRFTHAWIIYQGGSLPDKYQDKVFGLNPLLNFVQLSRFQAEGSTFRAIDEEKVLQTSDHWFRPVDIKAGPDGGVYLADWYDSRLSHVDPRDTWNKTTGRIYRLRNSQTSKKLAPFDLSQYNNQQLTELLKSENKWFRQQALRQFADHQDPNAVPGLLALFKSDNPQQVLEALWAINLSNGLTENVLLDALSHSDPYVRLWAVRLVGDSREASELIAAKLVSMTKTEPHLEVIGQLASSAKRLPGRIAVPMLSGLLRNPDSQQDFEVQMFIWWAMESKAISDRNALIRLFEDPALWELPVVKDIAVGRLLQRYALQGGNANYQACVRLMTLSPAEQHTQHLFANLQQSLRGVDINVLPSDLIETIRLNQIKFGEGALALLLRQNDDKAIRAAIKGIADNNSNAFERLSYSKILGEIKHPDAVPVLMKLAIDGREPIGLRLVAMRALGQYGTDEIGEKLVAHYPDKLRADRELREAALALFAGRGYWAKVFLQLVSKTKQVKRVDVPDSIVRQFKLLNDETLTAVVDAIWPEVEVTSSAEKTAEIAKIQDALSSGEGELVRGKKAFAQHCGACHSLFGEGGEIAPDLTGYDRNNVNSFILNIVDPNADIREGYVTYKIVRKDGQIMVGVLLDRSSSSITIKPYGFDATTLSTNEIETLEAQPISTMPERIIEHLTPQQIRDLFAYIRK